MDKFCRPVRNRRHCRKTWPLGDNNSHHRPTKRLFTPEIKRMLKDWLVRRRENPYPNRNEKKALAHETGLTYTQICNWFANWRRKLKNSEKTKKSWGTLIKNYNANTKGNVEQFSISSCDSIWEEEIFGVSEQIDPQNYYEQFDRVYDLKTNLIECVKINSSDVKQLKSKHEISNILKATSAQSNQLSLTTTKDHLQNIKSCDYVVNNGRDLNENQSYELLDYVAAHVQENISFSANTKYKQHIMQKYFEDTSTNTLSLNAGIELSKWLQSAATFIPNKNNYFFEWNNYNKRNKLEKKKWVINEKMTSSGKLKYAYESIHEKDEIDAAEALANLAFNYRRRILFPNCS